MRKGGARASLVVFLFISLFSLGYFADGSVDCDLSADISAASAAILCAVEQGRWFVLGNATAIKNVGCLLGAQRCDQIMKVPKENDVSPSPPPPEAKNKQYQALATKAETVVPKTWWRNAFANDIFLLSHNDSELPRKQFDAKGLKNKKLKNMVQCVTRQQFIRKSFSFESVTENDASKCAAASEAVVISFMKLWKEHGSLLGGTLTVDPTLGVSDWQPNTADNGNLLVSALQVLDYFYANLGGIWTGCFKMEKSAYCRGAVAGIFSSHCEREAFMI